MEYTAVEREDPGFIAETEGLKRDLEWLRKQPALDAHASAHLEWLIDEVRARTGREV